MELKFDGYDAIIRINDDGTESLVYDGIRSREATLLIGYMENEEFLQSECNRLRIELQERKDEIQIILAAAARRDARLKAEIDSLKAEIKLMATN